VISYTDAASGGVVSRVKDGRILARLSDFPLLDRSDETSAALSSNAQFVAVWQGQEVRIYEVATHRLLGAITNDQEVIEVQVDDRGRFVVVRGERGVQTRIWALSPLKEFARFSDNAVKRVRFSPDGSCFATIGGRVESVRLWRTIGGEEVTTIKSKRDLEAGSAACALDPSSEFLLMPGTADEAWVRAAKVGRNLATLPHRGVQRVAISRRNERLVTAGGNDGIRVWQLQRTDGEITGTLSPVALKEPGAISSMCLTDDGTRLFTTSQDGPQAIRIWNTANGEPIASIPNEFGADSIACSADGTRIVVGNGTSEVRVISVEESKILGQISHGQHNSSVSLTADGRYLATSASRDFEYQARLWDVSTGQQVAAATHDREVARVFFSPDGRSLVTAADDGTSRLWSLQFTPEGKLTGTTEVARIQNPGAVSMTADGRYLATAGDGTIRIWHLKPEDLVAQVQARSFRNLTRSEWKAYLGQVPYRKTCPEFPDQPEEREEPGKTPTASK